MSKATDIVNDLWLKEMLVNPNSNPQFENFYKEDLVRFCKIARKVIGDYKSILTELEEYMKENEGMYILNAIDRLQELKEKYK